MADDPDARLATLTLLDAAERRAGGGGVEPDGARRIRASSCIHELFEAQAARTPDAVAVRFAESR